MISEESRSPEWIREASKLNHAPDTGLVEKTIRAFCLLESLALSGLDFQFKGGSSLMLHFGSSRRMSIDVDIVCPPGTDIEGYVNRHAAEYGFGRVELVDRVSRTSVPKTHAKYYYEVAYLEKGRPEKILLDVLYEEPHYRRVERLPIRSPFLQTSGEDVFVNVPSTDDLLGDKLTAFAPHTTGIPFFKGKKNCSMEVVKQLFDIASLFDVTSGLGTVGATYRDICPRELAYRGLDSLSVEDALRDTFDSALCIASNGRLDKEDFARYADGVSRVLGFIHSERYSMNKASRDAAKAAYLAACLLTGKDSIEKFDPDSVAALRDMSIPSGRFSRLNTLKTSDVSSFFYWCKAIELIG